jgi:flagellin-like protein
MKNFRKSKKALSPVVASIILIAVTVAVSIAVAAWMGALTIGFMGTEELKITSMTFDTTAGTITIAVHNQGTSGVSINEVWVNGSPIATADVDPALPTIVGANLDTTFTINYGVDVGNNYQVKIVSAKGNPFVYNAIA